MCYVDDVVIATPTLEDHIDWLNEVFECMKRAGLKCKPSKCPKNLEPDLPLTIQIRQNAGTRPRKKYNPYGDDFVVDRIDLKKIVEEVVGLQEITVSQDIDIVDDHDDEWVDDRSKPEVEFDDEQQQSNEQDLTNLRVLEWLNEMTSNPKETSITIQDVDRESIKYMKTEREDPSWAAQEGRLLIPAFNLDLIPGMRSTAGTSMDIFVRCVGVGLTHTENLLIKKIKNSKRDRRFRSGNRRTT